MVSRGVVKRLENKIVDSPVSAVDIFCGAGGLTHGLMTSGIVVEAGIDVDPQCRFAYEQNNPSVKFIERDVAKIDASLVDSCFRSEAIRLLAGCAPCQPFSKLTNGIQKHRSWNLLDRFALLVEQLRPELVTMENVPELMKRGQSVFEHFCEVLRRTDYHIAYGIVNCCDYRVPQSRQRLVLLASQLGPLPIPLGKSRFPSQRKTVRKSIGKLPPLESGEQDPDDSLHVASCLSDLNLQRIRATPHDGGCRREWPDELILECHRRKSGERYHSIYGRMWWDRPAPTMTTLCNGIGNGRFGHPEQDRAISLREAAILQSFPKSYEFWPEKQILNRKAVGRMIGNAVPPALAKALGEAILDHVTQWQAINRSGHL
ncbi:DNA cytosine methyltransferase [Rubinisphaera sp.]|uniref:DNA cytosine methyltransferase n=1 Tax=Rubinisphaera sp. TaxID=2024857 RepID=UPI0025ED08A6|nr:DNA cytosine methyltransferase [Rubinisphaera sp.]